MSLTIEESKALLALCRAGKLYDIERWISVGKPIIIDPSLRKTALLTAMETGFHSLVELLARHEQRQEQKDRALADCAYRKSHLSRRPAPRPANQMLDPLIVRTMAEHPHEKSTAVI